MCGFIVGKGLKQNLNNIIEDIHYRGIPGYKGYSRYHDVQYVNIC